MPVGMLREQSVLILLQYHLIHVLSKAQRSVTVNKLGKVRALLNEAASEHVFTFKTFYIRIRQYTSATFLFLHRSHRAFCRYHTCRSSQEKLKQRLPGNLETDAVLFAELDLSVRAARWKGVPGPTTKPDVLRMPKRGRRTRSASLIMDSSI